ncbi:unnamed protein product [Bursaphelenchus xylophilus]|nr:unnamed protein product [Bursaphelenchus xylophilus]CAG9123669.1 unnamed protein product [Bursaphelenchus xylophilus]
MSSDDADRTQRRRKTSVSSLIKRRGKGYTAKSGDSDTSMSPHVKAGGCIVKKQEAYKEAQQSMEKSMKKSRRRRISGPTLDPKAKTAPNPEKSVGIDTPKTAADKPIDADKTTRSRRRKSSDDETAFDMMAQSMNRTWKKVRTKSKEKFRLVKTFVSAPLKEKGMQKMLDRITRRQQAARDPNKVLKQGDECFPQRRPTSGEIAIEMHKTPEKSKGASPKSKSLHTAVIESSIFLPDGRPFWQQKNKGDQQREMTEEDLTDDELPMNAEVIVQVHEGKVKLDNMPSVKLVLKPYGDLEEMKKRDAIFFNKQLVFSNTVRSMVNFVDDTDSRSSSKSSSDKSREQKPEKSAPSKLKITIPDTIYVYDYTRPEIGGWPFPFTPTEKGKDKEK